MKGGHDHAGWWCGLVLVSAAAAQLQAQDPPALTQLRQHYQSLLLEAEGPPRARWLKALEALERQKATAGDWDAAAAVRAIRLGKEEASAQETASGAGTPTITLQAPAARTVTGIDFQDNGRKIARFRRTGALMEWELPGQTPGIYDVILVYGVMGDYDESSSADPLDDENPAGVPYSDTFDTGAGGIVEFRKITNLTDGSALLRRTLKSTGGWAKTKRKLLGQVELDNKIVKFSLRAGQTLPSGLMDFHRLELVPSKGDGNAAGPVDAALRKRFEHLKEVYHKQYADQTRPLTKVYLKSLGDLEVAAGRNRDNDTLALVRQEKERLEQGAGAGTTAPVKERILPVTERLYILFSGEAKLTNQGDYLTRMRPAGNCEVTWKLAGLGVTSGTYRVEVQCRLGPGHGGIGVLGTATPGGAPGPSLGFAVSSGNSADAPRRPGLKNFNGNGETKFIPGTLTIPKGSEYLTLKVTHLDSGDGGLFDLKAVRLIPLPSAPQ